MGDFVVYLTLYSGTKLPKWYIGSSYIKKINDGYNGSVKSKKYREIYNLEQTENKHLFKTRILSYHKTREQAIKEELRLQKKHSVIKNEYYINEGYAQINGSHGRNVKDELNPNYGNKWTDKQKQDLSDKKKGIKAWNKGKTNIYSENTKTKMSKAAEGKIIVKDKLGNNFKVDKTNSRYLSGELVGITKGLFTVYNILSGEKEQVTKDEYKCNRNYLMNSLKFCYLKESELFRKIDLNDKLKNFKKITRDEYIIKKRIENATSK